MVFKRRALKGSLSKKGRGTYSTRYFASSNFSNARRSQSLTEKWSWRVESKGLIQACQHISETRRRTREVDVALRLERAANFLGNLSVR